MKKSTLKISYLVLLFMLLAGSLFAKTNVATYRIYIKSADAGGGSVNYICHEGDTLSFDFSPISNWKVYSITLNGTNVTNSLVNGIVTINGVTSNCTLNAVFTLSTNNNPPTPGNEGVKVYNTASEIVVDGTQKGETVTLYSLSGEKIIQLKSDGSSVSIPAQQNKVYLLKTSTQTFKIML